MGLYLESQRIMYFGVFMLSGFKDWRQYVCFAASPILQTKIKHPVIDEIN